jgi:hypothetical protein
LQKDSLCGTASSVSLLWTKPETVPHPGRYQQTLVARRTGCGPRNRSESIRSYWVFRLCPTSGILNAREHNVSGNGSVSVPSEGRETPTLLGPLGRFNINHWYVVHVFRIPDDGQVKIPVNLVVMHQFQNPLDIKTVDAKNKSDW